MARAFPAIGSGFFRDVKCSLERNIITHKRIGSDVNWSIFAQLLLLFHSNHPFAATFGESCRSSTHELYLRIKLTHVEGEAINHFTSTNSCIMPLLDYTGRKTIWGHIDFHRGNFFVQDGQSNSWKIAASASSRTCRMWILIFRRVEHRRGRRTEYEI